MKNLFGLLVMLYALQVNGQNAVAGQIRGQVLDRSTGESLPFSTVHLVGTDPIIGTVADYEGHFALQDIPIGRYTIRFSFSGYETYDERDVLVTSGKEVVIKVAMKTAVNALDEIIVTPTVNKLKTVNELAGISARMISVEEANRYAGGFDDPARLASSFAGVSSGIQSNGIVVRGNNPGALLWRMEGLEIPNPNHFADLSTFGGGGLTALSSQMLANSDFLMSAFPAPYTNALSGVFDLSMRSGNNESREHTFQAGLLGIDLASEGPVGKAGSSYLFNYRYSTLGLLEPILPENAGGTNYQDLAFKFKMPTRSAGTFQFWGLGLIDNSGQQILEDTASWRYVSDQTQDRIRQFMGSAGLKHLLYIGKSTFLESDVAFTSNGLDLTSDRVDALNILRREENISNTNWNFILQSRLNKQFENGNLLEFGVRSYILNYNLALQQRESDLLQTFVDDKGSSSLNSIYATSKLRLSQNLFFEGGINTQYFALNKQLVVEPRASLEWEKGRHTLGMAYGLHGRIERLNYYLNRDVEGIQQNRYLGMTRSHHFVGSYGILLRENRRVLIQPYFQHLFDVPVSRGSSFSFINLQNDWFINEELRNSGRGRNYGIDVTMEQFLTNGLYYTVSGSLMKSQYRGGDNVWRNTLFDRGYIGNFSLGKELIVGSNRSNILGLNVRITYQGGLRFTPIDERSSLDSRSVIEDEEKAYSEKFSDDLIVHFSASFRKNRARYSSIWMLSILNASMVEEFQAFEYNSQTNRIDRLAEAVVIPNLSYKIEF
ncbi:MAG: carboxypeptidase-like regulatory domain-containing protein [Bacteroidota bacterium]